MFWIAFLINLDKTAKLKLPPPCFLSVLFIKKPNGLIMFMTWVCMHGVWSMSFTNALKSLKKGWNKKIEWCGRSLTYYFSLCLITWCDSTLTLLSLVKNTDTIYKIAFLCGSTAFEERPVSELYTIYTLLNCRQFPNFEILHLPSFEFKGLWTYRGFLPQNFSALLS